MRPAGYYHEQAKVLRDGGPTYFNTLAQGFWMVTDYDACRDLLQRKDLFNSESFVDYEIAVDPSTLQERGSQLSMLSLPLEWDAARSPAVPAPA